MVGLGVGVDDLYGRRRFPQQNWHGVKHSCPGDTGEREMWLEKPEKEEEKAIGENRLTSIKDTHANAKRGKEGRKEERKKEEGLKGEKGIKEIQTGLFNITTKLWPTKIRTHKKRRQIQILFSKKTF